VVVLLLLSPDTFVFASLTPWTVLNSSHLTLVRFFFDRTVHCGHRYSTSRLQGMEKQASSGSVSIGAAKITDPVGRSIYLTGNDLNFFDFIYCSQLFTKTRKNLIQSILNRNRLSN